MLLDFDVNYILPFPVTRPKNADRGVDYQFGQLVLVLVSRRCALVSMSQIYRFLQLFKLFSLDHSSY